MGLNVGNMPVKQVYVGSTPVKAVHVGAQKVWPTDPRTVTIKNNNMGYFVKAATGDTDLIGSWPDKYGEQGVSFTVPVTCDRDVRNMNTSDTFRAGVTIPARVGVFALYAPGGTSFVFTEVL